VLSKPALLPTKTAVTSPPVATRLMPERSSGSIRPAEASRTHTHTVKRPARRSTRPGARRLVWARVAWYLLKRVDQVRGHDDSKLGRARGRRGEASFRKVRRVSGKGKCGAG
jgi:hypothetical protein